MKKKNVNNLIIIFGFFLNLYLIYILNFTISEIELLYQSLINLQREVYDTASEQSAPIVILIHRLRNNNNIKGMLAGIHQMWVSSPGEIT